jgi:acetyl-CoA carboxylase/biotin carboxylase 1
MLTFLAYVVSIVLCRCGQYQYSIYYTHDNGTIWKEEQAIRNIEPALAFQLELS